MYIPTYIHNIFKYVTIFAFVIEYNSSNNAFSIKTAIKCWEMG